MDNALTTQGGALLEQVIIGGDLSKLKPEDRVLYYRKVCESIGLNPLTKPFEYIVLSGKLTLYARRDASEQLRKIHGVSISDMTCETIGDVYVVKAKLTDKTGRTDFATGAVPVKGLSGDALANAYLKAETKCKRRGTLSICGLGLLDESEVDSIPGAHITPSAGALESLTVDQQGIVVETAQQIKALAANDQMMDAYSLWQDSQLDADQTVALFSLLPTKVKNLLGSMRDAERAQEKGVISPQQKKRLEAIIKDSGQDRETVKAECVKRWGIEHFQDLTREQYDEITKELESAAAQSSTADVITAPSPEGAGQGEIAPPADPELATKEEIQTIESMLEQGGKRVKALFDLQMKKNGWTTVAHIQRERVPKVIEWLDQRISA